MEVVEPVGKLFLAKPMLEEDGCFVVDDISS